MPVERRGWVIAVEIGSTGNGRNPIFNGRRQPSCDGTNRMIREYQFRICERLGVNFPVPTRQNEKVHCRKNFYLFYPHNHYYTTSTPLNDTHFHSLTKQQ